MVDKSNKTKFLIFIIIAVMALLYITFKSELLENGLDNEVKTQIVTDDEPIKNREVAIAACIKEAVKGDIPSDRALKTCTCFFDTAEKKYPADQISNILMVHPNPNGNDNERALSGIINICMEANPPEKEVIVEPKPELKQDIEEIIETKPEATTETVIKAIADE